MNNIVGHILFLIVLGSFAIMVPTVLWDPEAAEFILLLGVIAIWRYAWWGVNWTRSLIYNKISFPRIRKQIEDLGDDCLPSHVYLLVTSFRIGSETTRRVYDSVFAEAVNYGNPVTIVVSIVERCDEVMIRQLFQKYNPSSDVKLIIVRIGGTGKRDALAFGYRAISKEMPPEDAVVAVIDGDSLLSEGLIKKCASLFKFDPKIGALTTDELCEVDGAWIFDQWYSMRFAQRHIYMSSVSLSERVLTLTGRMSMFRADILVDPEFIERVELDWIDHWRLGRFKFLTGDDKSSWFHILGQGYKMMYVPDVQVLTIETPPEPKFVKCSVVLMRRWFGNMLRTNGRAIKLGLKPMGFFTWFSVLDQRLSMWTSLTGPVIALLATIFVTPFAIFYYLLWIMITRYIITLSFLAARPSVSAFWPFLLYYNQVVGSLVKTTVLFRLDKQKWTRQNTVLKHGRSQLADRIINMGSSYMHLFSFSLFVAILATISGILTVPDFSFWYHIINR